MSYPSRRALQLAIALALLAGAALPAAQPAGEEPAFELARTAVAAALARPAAHISFEDLKLVQDRLGAVVCGLADGKRFLVGPSGKPPPQIEGALSAPLFNYLWNARCRGMSAAAADETLGRELK